MAQTPVSSTTSYATADECLTAFDYRIVADLCSDRRGASPSQAALKDSSHQAGKKLAQALQAASGLVEAACTQGKRYSPADLSALTGVSRQHLVNLTCGLALTLLGERRWRLTNDQKNRFEDQRAGNLLERLRLGEHCFGLEENQAAGAGLSAIPMFSEVDDTRTTILAGRYFGVRGRR